MRRRSANEIRWAMVGLVALVGLLFTLPTPIGLFASAAPLAGSQGTDTQLPATESAVTVHGRGAFSSLEVNLSATRDLVNQAVSVSWTGVPPTFSNAATGAFGSTFNGNYMQIFQCWGDPDASDPLNADNPGPPPTQCEFGGESNNPSATYPIQENGFEFSRVLSQPTWATYDHVTGWLDPATGFKVLPYQSVDGTLVNQQADYDSGSDPLNPKAFWQNPYFSFNTTNEIPFARTYQGDNPLDGKGQQDFQLQTGLEAPGLGCGQKLQAIAGGGTKVPECWLVVVPRAAPDDENPAGLTGVKSVVTSPLAPDAWKNRIAIPLEFKPVDSSCAIGSDERRIVGSELATAAIGSWQPALCAQPNSPPYNYSYLSDDRARQNLTQQGFGGAGMSIFSRPPDADTVDAANPPVYSPLTVSGAVIGFNIERTPKVESDGTLQSDEVPLAGLRVGQLHLTPLLVAKLLTQSYQAQLVDILATKPAAYDWVLHNPTNIVTDPDFVRFNPEFALLSTTQEIDASGLLVEQPTSDAAHAIWQWILADPEAKAWLGGTPDPWGMKVNPIYSTKGADNLTIPSVLPKSDPYCFNSGETVGSPPKPARPICLLDWSPYALTMQASAQGVGRANSGAKTTLNPTGTPETAWSANGPQKAGSRFILSITDTASAARYGIQTAGLSRAGDDGITRGFVTADDDGLTAGVNAMTPDAKSGLLTVDPLADASHAYPLTLLTYAATLPQSLSAGERSDYAAFLHFATSDGQTAGVGSGQLPAGYLPLPPTLRTEADAAIQAILHPPAAASGSETTTTDSGSFDSGDFGSTSFDSSSSPQSAPTDQVAGAPASTPSDIKTAKPIRISTKAVSVGSVRYWVPAMFAIGLLAALCAPFIGRRRHRLSPAAPAAGSSAAPPEPPPAAPTRASAFKPWEAQ
jgi:hypothetical protein